MTKVSVSSIFITILIVAQYILAFFVYHLPGVPFLQWIGWAVWVISLVFGIGPIFILRKQGGVARGASYMKTTRLVDTSLYAVVRHPQYLAGILLNLAIILLAQHWLILLLGGVSAVLIWFDVQAADKNCIEKFGDEYRQYMQDVPQVNFLLGIIRHTRGKSTPKMKAEEIDGDFGQQNNG